MVPTKLIRVGFLAFAVAAFGSGCATRTEHVSAGPERSDEVAAVRKRTTNNFSLVFLCKPDSGSEDIQSKFAPLIIKEISPGSPTNAFALDRMYCGVRTCEVAGTPHIQISYVWLNRPDTHKQPQVMQGVRITLNSAGEPAIWETLRDTTGLDIIYVARTVESRATERYGSPLAGNAFTVEDRAVVARVIEDGPVPMGPIIYTTGSVDDIATVICRCMPSQAAQVAGTSVYTMVPAEALPEPVPWLLNSAQQNPFEGRLRLPPGF